MSFPPLIRRQVVERDFGMCVRCRFTPATNVHHRRPGKMGGSSRVGQDSPANGISLCGMGNASGCHGWVETHREEAYELGYLVHEQDNPAEVPLRWRGQLVCLDDLGTVKPCPS